MPYIYETVTECSAIEAFRRMGRLSTPDQHGNFTPNAVAALLKYHKQIAEDMGEPAELDVIAWCCDWSEYADVIEAAREHDNDSDVDALLNEYDESLRDERRHSRDDDEREQIKGQLLEWFQDNTQVIDFDTGVLIQAF